MAYYSISNLAWPQNHDDWCLDQLKLNGFSGVEISPTKLFGSWSKVNQNNCHRYGSILSSKGLRVSALQALTYGLDIHLDGYGKESDKLISHFDYLINVMQWLQVDIAVFGSPKLRHDGLNISQAIENFRIIGQRFSCANKTLVIEAIPKYYGSQCLTSLWEVARFISMVNSGGVKLHFDSGCQKLSSDGLKIGDSQLSNFLKLSFHAHLSRRDLAPFTVADEYSRNIYSLMRKNYIGEWITFEVLNHNFSKSSFKSQLKIMQSFME